MKPELTMWTRRLYHWSYDNVDGWETPWAIFLSLIGYDGGPHVPPEHYPAILSPFAGGGVDDPGEVSLLAAALGEFARTPNKVYAEVRRLLADPKQRCYRSVRSRRKV